MTRKCACPTSTVFSQPMANGSSFQEHLEKDKRKNNQSVRNDGFQQGKILQQQKMINTGDAIIKLMELW